MVVLDCLLSMEQDNGNFWKQICLNSGPSDICNIERSNDYQNLVMGLCFRDSKEMLS
jgi:hypothetical protein